jgi:hypothetical protein
VGALSVPVRLAIDRAPIAGADLTLTSGVMRAPISAVRRCTDRCSMEIRMTIIQEDIYRSSNGDRWRLVRDTGTGRAVVRHEANQASGGSITETDVEDFLKIDGSGPEFAALRRILDRPPRGGSTVKTRDPFRVWR